jgi:hypothetical protein
MASSLKKLTGMGGDVRKIAALLQKKAPPGHKLAYINDEEAALLKARGGSGKPHADTGIPSYELDDSFALQGDASGGPSTVAPTSASYGGDIYSAPAFQADYSAPSAVDFGVQSFGTPQAKLSGGYGEGIAQTSAQQISAIQPQISVPTSPSYSLTGGAPTVGEGVADVSKPEKPSWGERALTSLTQPDTIAKLGVGGLQAYLGMRAAEKAKEQGQAGTQQMQALATPYQQAGAQMQAQAQRGELTPQAQRSLQAIQAQAAQGAERRGGVGASQIQAQVEAFRQQLLQQQYDYGLKLSGIGDNIALGAIKTGLQADQYAQQLTNSYYNNIARTLYGTPTSTPAA